MVGRRGGNGKSEIRRYFQGTGLGTIKVVEDTTLTPIMDGSQKMLMDLNEMSCESRRP